MPNDTNWFPNDNLSINGEQISESFTPPTSPMPTPAIHPQPTTSGPTLTQVPVDKIKPNPWQPRKVFKQEYLQELADSIKEHGILQALVVVPTPDGNYQLIVGERRLRASQLAGLTMVPVIIRNAMEEQEKLELALIENIQRQNLDPIEEAQAYQQLISQYKLTQEEVAKKMGKSRPTVTNMLRLLTLPLKIQRAVAEGTITEGHARPMVSLPGMEKQLAMLDEVVKENMTVRQVENRVREIMERPKQVKTPRSSSDPEIQAIETELRGKLGTKVKLQKSGESGRITIEFYSQEELINLLAKIKSLEN
jgi:ParB family transcriptional regulator, chromosome partitioning protein